MGCYRSYPKKNVERTILQGVLIFFLFLPRMAGNGVRIWFIFPLLFTGCKLIRVVSHVAFFLKPVVTLNQPSRSVWQLAIFGSVSFGLLLPCSASRRFTRLALLFFDPSFRS